MERLALSTAELDPGPLDTGNENLFDGSTDQGSSEALQPGVVGSMLSKVLGS